MEVGRTMEQPYAAASATRVYAPTRGSAAYAYAQPAPAPVPEAPVEAPQPASRPLPARRPKPAARPLSLGGKLLVVASILMVTVASLLVIARYAAITQQYAIVNSLRDEIEASDLRLKQLNVALECAVSMEDAQAAAARMGMTYPTAAQYVAVGDPLPLSQEPAGGQPEGAGEPAG